MFIYANNRLRKSLSEPLLSSSEVFPPHCFLSQSQVKGKAVKVSSRSLENKSSINLFAWHESCCAAESCIGRKYCDVNISLQQETVLSGDILRTETSIQKPLCLQVIHFLKRLAEWGKKFSIVLINFVNVSRTIKVTMLSAQIGRSHIWEVTILSSVLHWEWVPWKFEVVQVWLARQMIRSVPVSFSGFFSRAFPWKTSLKSTFSIQFSVSFSTALYVELAATFEEICFLLFKCRESKG